MKEVEIKNERGEVINKVTIPESSDYAQYYKDAKSKVEQMQECLKILYGIIEQQKTMKTPVSLNLISLLATLDYCDRSTTDILIKPMAKACRKALHRNEVAMNNFYKLAKSYLDKEEK